MCTGLQTNDAKVFLQWLKKINESKKLKYEYYLQHGPSYLNPKNSEKILNPL